MFPYMSLSVVVFLLIYFFERATNLEEKPEKQKPSL